MEHPFSQLEVVIEKINYLFGQMKNDASKNNLGNKVELSLLKKYGTSLYDRIIELEKIAGREGSSRKARSEESSESLSCEKPSAIESKDATSTKNESKKILFAEPGSRIMRRVKKINTISGEHIEIHDDDIIEEGTINEYVQPKDNILSTETISLPNSKINELIVEAEEPIQEKLITEAKRPLSTETKIEVVKGASKKKKKKKANSPKSSIEKQGIKDFNQPEALTFEIDLKQAKESKTTNEQAASRKPTGLNQILGSLSPKTEVESPKNSSILPKAALAGIATVVAGKSSSEDLLETILETAQPEVEAKTEQQASQSKDPIDASEAETNIKAEAVNESSLEEKQSAPADAPVKKEKIAQRSKKNSFQINQEQKNRFTTELFGGEQAAYQETLTAMSECSNVLEAYTHVNLKIKNKYNWDSNSPTVKEFQKIVKDNFLA